MSNSCFYLRITHLCFFFLDKIASTYFIAATVIFLAGVATVVIRIREEEGVVFNLLIMLNGSVTMITKHRELPQGNIICLNGSGGWGG